MRQSDFVKLIGAETSSSDFLPVACLLQNGYACVGYYHREINDGLEDTCVLVNARLIDLSSGKSQGNRFTIHDFNDFLEETVARFQTEKNDPLSPKNDEFGKSIPLSAIPFEQIVILYPISHIGELMAKLRPEQKESGVFLDFEKSEIVNLLRTKLWSSQQ